MKKILYNSLVVLIAILCCVGCRPKEKIDAEKYTSYVCYDYHLICYEVEKKSDVASIPYTIDYPWMEEAEELSQTILFRKIANESDEQFVYGHKVVIMPGYFPTPLIFQNPLNYIDVLEDWTVEKVELYYEDSSSPSVEDYRDVKKYKPITKKSELRLLSTTGDSAIFEQLKDFITNDEKVQLDLEQVTSNGYVWERFGKQSADIYLRIYFNESENIVWETSVESLLSEELKERIIIIDKGRTVIDICKEQPVRASINDYEQLYTWISEAMDGIYEEE